MECPIKYYMGMVLGWHKRILVLHDKNYIIKREKNRDIFKGYNEQKFSLRGASIIDQSNNEKKEQIILIYTTKYKNYIKFDKKEHKEKFLKKLIEMSKTLNYESSFSKEYQNYRNYIQKNSVGKSPFDIITIKISYFNNLLLEMNKKLIKFDFVLKNKTKTSDDELRVVCDNLTTIKEEMKGQFDELIKQIYDYHDICEGKLIPNEIDNNNNNNNIINENIISTNSSNLNPIQLEMSEGEQDPSSSEDEISIEKKNSLRKLFNIPFLSTDSNDFKNPLYSNINRQKLSKEIKGSNNMVKEFIKSTTKKESLPIYFNEPISMLQKQCEKFFYSDLLKKANETTDKALQLCYITGFVISELFLNIGRILKPFNPVCGETFEFYDNEKNFRYFSEQVAHVPPITAFICESEDFVMFGDTNGSTSFKFFKGSVELTFVNKIHLKLKKSGNYYVFNRPIISMKGLVKAPIHNDCTGNIVIQNCTDKNYRCEVNFIEEGWSGINSGGKFEGKVINVIPNDEEDNNNNINDEDEDNEDDNNKNEIKRTMYLIKGNWNKEIYYTDPEGNNKVDLLKIDESQEYLKNTYEKYVMPNYSYKLNYATPELLETLPPFDCRKRPDLKEYEEGDSNKAQIIKYKIEYKQKMRLIKLKDEGKNYEPKYFEKKYNVLSNDDVYMYNGKYWDDKKNGKFKELKKEDYDCDIFDYENVVLPEKK